MDTGRAAILDPEPAAPGHLAERPTRAVLAGSVAAAVALGSSELVASLGASLPSLVVGVGGWFIDRSPGDVTRAAIETLGTANKTVLIWTIVVVTITLGGVVGRVWWQRRSRAATAFVVTAIVGGLASVGEPGATAVGAAVVALVAAASGVGTYLLLWSAADGRLGLEPARTIESPTDPHASRRSFLGFAGAGAAFAGLSAAGGRYALGRSPTEVAREAIVLPTLPAGSTSPLPDTEPGIDGLSPLYTPNDDFFRIDTALRVPQVDLDGWSMTIDGMVENPLTLTFDDLLAMDLVESDVTLACVSNQVGGNLVGNARWLGVPLAELLERVGVDPGAEQVVGHSVDGFTAGFPLDVLDDGRPALVAVGMNGEPLPLRHGFPARLVVSGLFGYVSATKWLSRIELAPWEGVNGYWIPRGWSKEGPVHTQTRIDVPADRTTVAPGRIAVAGVAWAPSRGVAQVEMRVDDGPWTEVELSEEIGDHAWRQWWTDWNAEEGTHILEVRSTDGTGETQTETIRPPAPSGATGWHRIRVRVEA